MLTPYANHPRIVTRGSKAQILGPNTQPPTASAPSAASSTAPAATSLALPRQRVVARRDQVGERFDGRIEQLGGPHAGHRQRYQGPFRSV
ncbi:MAG: hypothetical protein WKG07_43825 [Hymenobacter sp.]